MTTPGLAVVIPVRNAVPTLPGLLAALAPTIRRSDVEVCFVDDASTDDTPAWLRAQGFDPFVRPRRGGPAAARNEGVRLTTAPLILFCDADTEPPGDVASRVMAALLPADVVAVVGVYSVEPLNAGFWPRYKAIQAASYHQSTAVTEINWLWASMAGVKREAFDAVSGFDERFGGADLEDVELGRRLSQLGRILLDRDFVVGHHFAATLAANIRNHYHRGRLWAELFLGRPAFDNYLTNRRHGLSRLLLVVGSTALVGAVAGAGTVWPIAALSAFVINAWLTRDLYRLAFGKGGVLFAGGVSLAEILLSWILLGAGFRACLRTIVVAVSGGRPVDRSSSGR